MGDSLKATANTSPDVIKNYWYKDGTYWDTSSTLVLYEPGTYMVYCETENGCVSEFSLPIIVSFDTLSATRDERITVKNTAIDITVLDNDHIPDCSQPDLTSMNVTIAPSNGNTAILANGDITYIPNMGFVGVDSFLYTFQDEFGNATEAWVYITIDNPLPIQLLSFYAYKHDQKSKLYWKVATEINVSNYTVERSKDALQFESIGIVIADNHVNYTFLDEQPMIGANYYRLRIIDQDGTYIFSDVKEVFFDSKDMIKIYPNPTIHNVHVDLGNNWQQIQAIFLADMNGKQLASTQVTQAIMEIDLSKYPAQVFVISILQKDGTHLGSFKLNKIQ